MPAAIAIAAENASTRQSSVSRTAPMVSGTSVSRNRMTGQGQRESGDGAESGEHQALGEELRDQPAASGAERCAHRHFAAARRPARHQQVRQIDARDQQTAPPTHTAARSATRSVCPGQLFPQRRHDRRARGLGCLPRPTRCRLSAAIDSCACSQRDTGLQPGDDVHVVPREVPHLRREAESASRRRCRARA